MRFIVLSTIKALALAAFMLMLSCQPAQGTTTTASPRGTTSMATAGTVNAFLSTYHADAGSTVPLGDGRILWLFGDTFRGDGTMDRNTAVVQAGDTFIPLPGTFATPPAQDHWYWPGNAIREGTNLRVLMQDYYRTGDGAWDWAYSHTDVLSYSLPDLQLMGRVSLPQRVSGAIWGPLRRAGNGYTYIYGAYPVVGQLGKAYEVARVPNGRLANPTAWQYLGTKLMPDLELGSGISVIRTATGYRLWTKRLDMWTEEIISYDATSPTGPWTNRRVVLTTPQPTGTWTYSVEAHPEQGLLSYATNCSTACPEYHLTAVPLS